MLTKLTLKSKRNYELFALDGYYMAYKLITLLCSSFKFIQIKFIDCYSCMMFTIKSMNICNDKVNYDEIIIQ